MIFPDRFLWGVATSAYQIEGSPDADGAGESNWDRFCREPGRIRNGETGDTACDHYRRFEQDVALMQRLGIHSYRFSVAWSRILPEGRGRINAAGLGFYERLVDTLLEVGIVPNLTLYHWDLPAALDDLGGWLAPDSPDWFAEYAQVVARALGDRVPYWCTLNEPWVSIDAGYQHGVHPPGRRSTAEALAASRHLLLAHGRAISALRSETDARLGLVVNIEPKKPATDAPADIAAARRADAAMNLMYLDPVLLGRSPAGIGEVYGDLWTEPTPAEAAEIAAPLDWLGVNYYTSTHVRHADEALPVRAATVPRPDARRTLLGWEFRPDDLTATLVRIHDRYPAIPLMVTENGAALKDPPPGPNGLIDDPDRVDYLLSHVAAVADARRAGVDVRGYYAWSLLDNFEWAEGYTSTFGLVHVDHATGHRTLKRSALVYADLIAKAE